MEWVTKGFEPTFSVDQNEKQPFERVLKLPTLLLNVSGVVGKFATAPRPRTNMD